MAAGATLGKAYIEIDADLDRFKDSLKRGLEKLAALGIAVVAFKKLSDAGSAARKSLLLAFGSMAGAAIAGAAAGKIAALVGSLSQLVGIAAAVPAAIALGGAAIAGLMVATKGLGEAFKAAFADEKKFEEAIAQLSPMAQQLAREFKSVVPELHSIKVAAQDAFAGPLLGQIDQTVKALAGPLADGLAKVSVRYGEAAAKVLEFARSQQNLSFLDSLFEQTGKALEGIGDGIPGLLTGFQNAAMAILPMFSGLGGGLTAIFEEIGMWLTKVSQNGDLQRWLEQAMSVLGDLWTVVAGLGQVLFEVFSSASAAGSNLLQVLGDALNTFANFLQSAEGASALNSLFTALGQLAAGLAPLLGNVLLAIGPVLAAIAPAVQAVVPVLVKLSEALGPALAAIAGPLGQALLAVVNAASTLVPYLVPLGEVIGTLLDAVLPLIDALVWLAEPFQPLVEALGTLVAAIIPIVNVLGPILLQVFQILQDNAAPILRLIVTVFEQLGQPVADLVAALGGALLPLFQAVAPILNVIVDVLLAFLPAIVALTPAITEIVIALTPLIDLAAQLITWLAQLVGWLVKVVAGFASWVVVKALVPIIVLIAKAVQGLFAGLGKLPGLIGQFAGWLGGKLVDGFKALPGLIWDAITGLPQLLWKLFTSAFDLALKAIGVGIGIMLFTFLNLPGLIGERIGKFFEEFPKKWSEMWTNIGDGLKRFGLFLVEQIAALPGRLGSVFSALGTFLHDTWEGFWRNATMAFANGVNEIVGFFTSIPGRIASLPGQLFDFGVRLINAIGDGLKSVGDFAGGVAQSIVNALKGFLNGVIGTINSGIGAIDAKLPGPSLPRIPYLAEGDVIRKPTLAVVAEAGAEAVIPLTRPQRARDLLESSGLADLVRGAGQIPQLVVRVFLGTREITDIVRVEVDRALDTVAANVTAGARA